MIKVKGLNKFYNKNKSNELHVINDVTLELPSQGLVSFLGASGSGKTTLLNVIGGLDKASGTLSYDSFEMQKYDMRRIDKYRNEHFGYVFQSYNLLLEETVYDNLRIALELVNIYDPDEVSARIEYALTSVGMYKYRKKKASQLSGGQQQRVAIARALVKHCKVIIADEPTGNLDSANAVEVMNILKSISKKTLVLLVTHNESLAKFYSDYIYRISDGMIVDKSENVGSESLDAVNDNVVYLKDMALFEAESERVAIKLYSNTDSALELEIVERNNTFYIKSNKTVKLLESSNLKLVYDHYKPTEKKSTELYDYDDSFFNNEKSKRNIFGDALTHLKRSLMAFIKPTKRVKAIYASLILIGMLFAMCAISISNALTVDTSEIYSDDAYSTFYDGRFLFGIYEDGEILKEALQKGEISSAQNVLGRYITFAKKLNYVEEKSYQFSSDMIYFNTEKNTISHGRAPESKEVAISRGIADDIIANFDGYIDSYEDLFGLVVDSGNSVLVGIVDNPGKMIYISEKEYVNEIASWIYVPENHFRYYYYEKQYDSYEIVAGRDLTDLDAGTGNILISADITNAEELIGTQISEGVVVGVYRLKSFKGSPEEVIVHGTPKEVIYGEYLCSYETEEHVIVEGREALKENECIVSMYSNLNIGEELDGYEIVGKYNASTVALDTGAMLSTSALSIRLYSTKIFVVEDEDAFLQTVDGAYEVMSMYDSQLKQISSSNDRKMTVFSVLGVICLIAASILVFFIMRSKMVNDIYGIGVYRSLGSSKTKIYAKYFFDTLVMASFTTFVAYVIVLVLYYTATSTINSLLATEIFTRNLSLPIFGVGVLYAVNIVFGLLPIVMLLRRTPSEILAKYDI